MANEIEKTKVLKHFNAMRKVLNQSYDTCRINFSCKLYSIRSGNILISRRNGQYDAIGLQENRSVHCMISICSKATCRKLIQTHHFNAHKPDGGVPATHIRP